MTEDQWFANSEAMADWLKYGNWRKPWRRLAIILFPVSIPVWFLWQITVACIFLIGLLFITSVDNWNKEDK